MFPAKLSRMGEAIEQSSFAEVPTSRQAAAIQGDGEPALENAVGNNRETDVQQELR